MALREVAEVNMDVVVAEKGQLLEMGRVRRPREPLARNPPT